jgi:hypothetical protein
LLGLSQPNTPTFTPYQGSSMSPVNIGQMMYDKYNADQQSQSDMMSGMFGLGANVLRMLPWSDRRLKKRIIPTGTKLAGVPLYTFQFRKHVALPKTLWGVHRTGVMSDEVVKLHPDAVHRRADGYDRVNYELLYMRQAQ